MAEREGGPGRTGRGGELPDQGREGRSQAVCADLTLQELPLIELRPGPASWGTGSSLVTLVVELLHLEPRQSPPPHIPCVHGTWTHLPCPRGAVWEQGGFWGIMHFQRQKRGISGFFLHQRHLAPVARPEHRTLSSDRWGWVLGHVARPRVAAALSLLCEGQ